MKDPELLAYLNNGPHHLAAISTLLSTKQQNDTICFFWCMHLVHVDKNHVFV